ncbi:MAG TPA: hypothetical protein V6C58_08255, partial [Allocoleopsis sp.]
RGGNLVSEPIIYAIMTKLHTRNQVSVRDFKSIKNYFLSFPYGMLRKRKRSIIIALQSQI